MTKLERIYIVPLGDAYEAKRNKRAPKAVKILRAFITRHMKADGEKIIISEKLNKFIWTRSIQKPPRKIKVRLIKDDGKINAYLSDEKIEEPKKEEKPKGDEKKPEAKKEEKPKTEEKKVEPKGDQQNSK
ncbi:MAG: 50S ribosomal protein L31e [Candidatus Micrarchaeota archaeon]